MTWVNLSVTRHFLKSSGDIRGLFEGALVQYATVFQQKHNKYAFRTKVC